MKRFLYNVLGVELFLITLLIVSVKIGFDSSAIVLFLLICFLSLVIFGTILYIIGFHRGKK
jgi:fatty-acid desaturase